MKYALVDGARQEAQPKIPGICPCCDSPVIPKCGRVRKPYWAHKSKQICDSGKESETPWHRAWKDCFPKEWQEIVHTAENGNKHRADVKTDQGYAIEFQHSPIKFEERQSREDFYKSMLWIVNGTRRPNDKETFINLGKCTVPVKGKGEMWKLKGGFEKCPLLRDWGDSNAPVFFDFGENFLLGILPKDPSDEERYMVGIDRNALIESFYPAKEKSFKRFWIDWFFSIGNSQQKKKTVSSSQNPQPQQINYALGRHSRRRRL